MNTVGEMTAPAPKPASRAGQALAVTGAFLQAGLLFGALGATRGMIHACGSMGTRDTVPDPSGISHAVSEIIISTFVGFAAGSVGLLLMLAALLGFRYRRSWLVWTLLISAGGWCFAVVNTLLIRQMFSGMMHS